MTSGSSKLTDQVFNRKNGPFDLGLFDVFLIVRAGLWRSALLSTQISLFKKINLFLAPLCDMQDLSSLTRDRTVPPAPEARIPNHQTTREVPTELSFEFRISGVSGGTGVPVFV